MNGNAVMDEGAPLSQWGRQGVGGDEHFTMRERESVLLKMGSSKKIISALM